MAYPQRVQIHRTTIPKVGTVWTAYRFPFGNIANIRTSYNRPIPIGFQPTLGELLPIFPHADVHDTSESTRDIVKTYPDVECVTFGGIV
jgi:hypothetical protein